jgi:hypothetical protein
MKYSIIGLFPGPQAGDAKLAVRRRILSEAVGCTFHRRFRVSLQRTSSRAVGHFQPLAGEEIEPGKSHYSS